MRYMDAKISRNCNGCLSNKHFNEDIREVVTAIIEGLNTRNSSDNFKRDREPPTADPIQQ
jgi:hypothetical protein